MCWGRGVLSTVGGGEGKAKCGGHDGVEGRGGEVDLKSLVAVRAQSVPWHVAMALKKSKGIT